MVSLIRKIAKSAIMCFLRRRIDLIRLRDRGSIRSDSQFMTYPPPPQPGPPNQYGQWPAYPPGEPPKSNRGLIIALVVIPVLALVIGLTAWILVTGGDTGRESRGTGVPSAVSNTSPSPATGDETTLLATARAYTDAVNASDEAAATALTCSKADPGTMYDALAGEATAVVGEALLSRNGAMVDITVEGVMDQPIPLHFEYLGGAWCVAM
ncbi:hypothetical protein ABZV91_16525 [Nocardia sp. NPDC004568]|uniref:hypothetical protein n=1 Tax=Nocardia sp. NPDC004568 TaxID=3154551 RepID=UPI0033BC281E